MREERMAALFRASIVDTKATTILSILLMEKSKPWYLDDVVGCRSQARS